MVVKCVDMMNCELGRFIDSYTVDALCCVSCILS